MAPSNDLNSLFQVCSRGSCFTLCSVLPSLLCFTPTLYAPASFPKSHFLWSIFLSVHLLLLHTSHRALLPWKISCLSGKILVFAPLFASLISAASIPSEPSSHPLPLTLQCLWNWNIWLWGEGWCSGDLGAAAVRRGQCYKTGRVQSCTSLLLLPGQLLAGVLKLPRLEKPGNKKEKEICPNSSQSLHQGHADTSAEEAAGAVASQGQGAFLRTSLPKATRSCSPRFVGFCF